MRSPWATTLLIVAALFLAGCLRGAPTVHAPVELEPFMLEADCSTTGFVATDSGVCARFIRTSQDSDEWEPHLATHPTDPRILLLTANKLPPMVGENPYYMHVDARSIWAAISTDAGATWRTTAFSEAPQALQGLPQIGRFAFDSIAGFGRDGTAYVLYGGEELRPNYIVIARTQMTVARSTDLGATWTFHRFHVNLAGVDAHDYMDMAVAPDRDSIYVAADVFTFPLTSNTIMFWRSQDGGSTWSERKALTLEGQSQFPRLAAGADGLVVATVFPYAEQGSDYAGFDVLISRDGGATFSKPRSVVRAPLMFIDGVQPTVWDGPDGRTRIDVGYSVDNKTYRVSSWDHGATWSEPTLVANAPHGHVANIHETAVDRDGAWYALKRYGLNSDPGVFGIKLVRTDPNGMLLEETELANKTGVRGAPFIGGHYGGLGVAIDGTVWAAWGDPRVQPAQIALAALRTE